jgi:beta-glucosidase
LTSLITRVYHTYRPAKIVVAENGAAYPDAPDENGKINDIRRIKYLQGHLVAIHRAIQAGVPVSGYFLWSLMDNFEWGEGFSQRFGLVWVDFETQKRIPKASAYFYGKVAGDNRLEITE